MNNVNANEFLIYYKGGSKGAEKSEVNYFGYKFKNFNILKEFDKLEVRKYLWPIYYLEIGHRIYRKEFRESTIVHFLKHSNGRYCNNGFIALDERKIRMIAKIYMKIRNS
jgi:hypothetical protein